MDPVSILQIAGFAGSASKGAIEVAKDLYVFCNEVRNVDQTVHGLVSEVQALGGACALVDERLRQIVADHETTSSIGASKGRLWSCIELQVTDSRRTIEQLKTAFQGVREQGGNVLSQVWRQIKLNTKTKDIAEARNRIRSHTASLQMVLQTVAIEICYVAPQKADQQLQTLLVKAEQCVEHLKHLRAQSTENDVAQQAREDEMIAVSEETLSNGESLYAASVANGSMLGDPSFAGRASHVHDWIQDVSAIERTATALSAIAETDLHSTTSADEHSIIFSEDPSRRESTAPTSVAHDHHKDHHGNEYTASDCDYDSEDDFLVDAAKEALDTGRTSFQSREYADASEYLQEALKIVRELPARRQALVCDTWEIRYLLSVCAYHTQSLTRAKTNLWSVVEYASRSSLQDNDQRKQCCEAGHLLSIVCVKLGSLEEARQYCESALKARHKLFGRSHPESFRSLALLARILSIQGHLQRAKIYSRMIPESDRGPCTKEFKDLTGSAVQPACEAVEAQGSRVNRVSSETAGVDSHLHPTRRSTLDTQADSTDSGISMSYDEKRSLADSAAWTASPTSSSPSQAWDHELGIARTHSVNSITEGRTIVEESAQALDNPRPTTKCKDDSKAMYPRHAIISEPAAVSLLATTPSPRPVQQSSTFLDPDKFGRKGDRTPSPDDRTSIASFKTAIASPRPTRASSLDDRDRAYVATSRNTAIPSGQDKQLLNSILNRAERREIADLLPKMRDLDQSLANVCKHIKHLEQQLQQSVPEKLIVEVHAAEWALGKARRYAYGSRRPSARLEYETAKKSANAAVVLLKEYEILPEKQRSVSEDSMLASPTSAKKGKLGRFMSIRNKPEGKMQELVMETSKGDIKLRLLDDAKAFKQFSWKVQNNSFTNMELYVAPKGIEARNSARECSFIITPPPTRLTDASDALLGYVIAGLDIVQETFEPANEKGARSTTMVHGCRFTKP
ncbi:hypothetical protein AC579_634 [Pseudocercospora musae]|uniref:Fungal N-terminal domain-containing protein n=1 Tax=Pseudocercospora musae TaxID=113226 RepID=A0A139H9C1_9PEZI|nr:hypothetical protein AC579_634 [Pseudocercospora musae]KXS99035.1 hypothetical protein AC579_634 [Pseudocercospora musae]KXS99036.1 hypothetical protein AC579_634 [Pseudocercospora musae]KXS99037.1 hypothetical protein AC579_634 [Pseudocercospora musae]KXS99038.1 hypothetical protein AC579_634 [Pseudocercospora musae]